MSIDYVAIGKSLAMIRAKGPTGMSIGIAADGGAVDGSDIVLAVIESIKDYSDSILENLRWVEVRLNDATVPYDGDTLETEPSTGTRAYWVEEGIEKTISVPALGNDTLSLRKLVVRIPVTDELLHDYARLGEYLVRVASRKVVQKVSKEAIKGQNAIKGVMADGDQATILVACSNVAAPTLTELQGAVDKIHPLAQPTWYVTPALYSYIIGGMTGTDTMKASALRFEDGVYYLFGYPVEKCPWLTSTYSWLLGDFGQYVVAYKAPTQMISSDTPRFEYDESEFRLVFRCAGRPANRNQACDDGVTYGWFVTHTANVEAYQSSSSESSQSQSSMSSSSLSTDESESSQSSQSNSSQSSASSLSSLSTLTSVSSQSTLESISSISGAVETVGTGMTPSVQGAYDLAGEHNGQPMYHSSQSGMWMWYASSSSYWYISTTVGVISGGAARNISGSDGAYEGINGWVGTATASL